MCIRDRYRIPLAFPKTTQGSVDQLIARCAADDACRKDFPNLKKEFQEIVDRLEKTPAHFEVDNGAAGTQPVTLTRGMFAVSYTHLGMVPKSVPIEFLSSAISETPSRPQ